MKRVHSSHHLIADFKLNACSVLLYFGGHQSQGYARGPAALPKIRQQLAPPRGFLTTRSRKRAVSLVERRASSPVNPGAARHWSQLKGGDLSGRKLLQPANSFRSLSIRIEPWS